MRIGDFFSSARQYRPRSCEILSARRIRFHLLACVSAAIIIASSGFAAASEVREIQEALIWVGYYNGLINGHFNEATTQAVRSFQKYLGRPITGNLTDEEANILFAKARKKKDHAGFERVVDDATGIEIGLPTALLRGGRTIRTKRGINLSGPGDVINIDTLRFSDGNDGKTLSSLYARLKRAIRGRRIDYEAFRTNWFVLEGRDADGLRFYLRFASQGDELRGFSVMYPEVDKSEVFPIVIAMSNSFDPFSNGSRRSPLPNPGDIVPKKLPDGPKVADIGEACKRFPDLCY